MTDAAPRRTMFEKIWDDHVVHAEPGKQTILYIDLQLVHEVTSPQAFEGLRLAGRKVRRPERTVATADHNVPTTDRSLPIADPISKQQIDTLRKNCREFGIRLYDLHDPQQGIVHVIGPELGCTQPGMTIVCGDSHTATHGAFGALAFGIGTSEVEHVLATQTLLQYKPKTMEIRVDGRLPRGRHRQGPDPVPDRPDSRPPAAPATCIEYTGEAIRALSMEERMTVCNMSIEAGARAGMIAPDADDVRLSARPRRSPRRISTRPSQRWQQLPTDPGATYDRVRVVRRRRHRSRRSPGAPTPGQVAGGRRPRCPIPADFADATEQQDGRRRRWSTWACKPGTPITTIPVDRVFIGSCTNGRIEDLRAAAAVVRGLPRRQPRAARWSCPAADWSSARPRPKGSTGSSATPGFEWREAGCSMCLAMNPDKLEPGERCAATSNRNFEGRQGKGGRTHLVSPAMAAAAAVAGHFVDIREWEYK